MTSTLSHRGPDASGVWVDAAAGIGLGHRRLSILDLSAAGAQPMTSACGRYVTSYNGEIYNFRELRAELAQKGHTFRGHSDTEVLLAAVAEWGLEGALERINGMFALALWDRKERELSLARDRVGKKPLYYGRCGNSFIFGSELKALACHPEFDREIDRDALGQLIQLTWIPTPHSIFRNVRKLPAASILRVRAGDSALPEPCAYWSAREVAERGEAEPFKGGLSDAVDALDALLGDAVAKRMIADVSLGALLSGGIDSSTIVSLMQSQSDRPVKTFSIGFRETGYNEAEHANEIASHLGTEHTELYVTARDALDVIPRLPQLYDEPFADSSQIPTFLVSQLARRDVTVALSGDGGDELFCGYTRYFRAMRAWSSARRVPRGLRRPAARWLRRASDASWRSAGESLDPSAGGRLSVFQKQLAKLEKRARMLDGADPLALLARSMERCLAPAEFVLGARDLGGLAGNPQGQAELKDPFQRMMASDFEGYLTDDILVKVDRASMATSLEVRSPLLDHRVVALAWSLPIEFRVSNTTDASGGKLVLKELLARYLPRALWDRRKMGFGVPIEEWLRGPLHEWAEDLLSEKRLREEGYFDVAAVRRSWQQHQVGWRNRDNLLWAILMFQAWQDGFADGIDARTDSAA